MERKWFRPADLILLAAAAAVCLVLLLWQHSAGNADCTAVIEQDGQELRRISLSALTQEERIDLGGDYHVVLLAEPGAISFLSSDCPDQICVRTGKLTKPGQAAVCLPARISVRLEGENEGGADAMTG